MTQWRRAALLVLLPLLGAAPAWAGDRPFLATSSALVEDDEDRALALEAWVESGRGDGGLRTRQWRTQAEYNFDPWTSVQIELGAARVQDPAGAVTERGVEVEARQVLRDIDRHGWGFALALGGEWQAGGPDRSRFLYAPMSWRLPDAEGYVHLNLGAEWRTDRGTRARWALGAEHELNRHWIALAEAGGVAGSERLAHAGFRYWFKRDKLAFDAGIAERTLIDADVERRSRMLVLGFAVRDIDF